MWNELPVKGKSLVDKIAGQIQHCEGKDEYKNEVEAVAVLE